MQQIIATYLLAMFSCFWFLDNSDLKYIASYGFLPKGQYGLILSEGVSSKHMVIRIRPILET